MAKAQPLLRLHAPPTMGCGVLLYSFLSLRSVSTPPLRCPRVTLLRSSSFPKIPKGTDYGEGKDAELNQVTQ